MCSRKHGILYVPYNMVKLGTLYYILLSYVFQHMKLDYWIIIPYDLQF